MDEPTMALPILEHDAAGVRTLVLNRPQVKNAFDMAMLAALQAAIARSAADPAVRAVVLTGSGSVFCSGVDLGEFAAAAPDQAQALRQQRADALAALVQALHDFGKPLVGALNGSAIGAGLAVALVCDWLVASDAGRYGLPELRHGVLPSMVMAPLLYRAPWPVAFELIFGGELVDAATLRAQGLVNQVGAAPDVAALAARRAAALAALQPALAQQAKALLRRSVGVPFAQALEIGSHLFAR